MGSTGSWSAGMSLRKKVDISTKVENSSEDIKKFIDENETRLYSAKGIEDINEKDILMSIVIYDEDEDEQETILMKDIGLENVNAKNFVDNDIYEDHDVFESDEYDTDPSCWIFKMKDDNIEQKLKFVNLEILGSKILSGSWSSHTPNFIYEERHLGSCGDDIYYENDNSGMDSFEITQDFIDSLSPGDELIVTGDGDCY